MKQIALRLDDEMAEAIDKAREGTPRERWIKQALATALSGPPSVAAPPPERGSGPASARSSQVERAREAASSRTSSPSGCREHPVAGAVESRGRWWCAEPGCTRPAARGRV